jgi:hypothetical protein
VLLITFWIIGSGKFSFDEYMKNHPAYKMKWATVAQTKRCPIAFRERTNNRTQIL